MNATDIEKLKELATKATPGPWVVGNVPTRVSMAGYSESTVLRTDRGMCPDSEQAANAEFVATANPEAVLSLIAALEAKDAEIERLTKALGSEAAAFLQSLVDECSQNIAARKAAEAALKEAREKAERVFANPCIQKLKPDEPFFVLLGRDPQAAFATESWALFRDDVRGPTPKTAEARKIAAEMREYALLSKQDSGERT